MLVCSLRIISLLGSRILTRLTSLHSWNAHKKHTMRKMMLYALFCCSSVKVWIDLINQNCCQLMMQGTFKQFLMHEFIIWEMFPLIFNLFEYILWIIRWLHLIKYLLSPANCMFTISIIYNIKIFLMMFPFPNPEIYWLVYAFWTIS